MKKKIFTIVIAIALISVVSLCLFACNKDKDEGKLNENTDFEKLVSAEVTEEVWKEAFNIPENVTVKQHAVSSYVTKDENGEDKTESSTNDFIIFTAKDKFSYKSTDSDGDSYEAYCIKNSDGSILFVTASSYYDESEEKQVTEGPYGKTITSDDDEFSGYEEYFNFFDLNNSFDKAFADKFDQFSYDAEKGAYVAESITYTETYGENNEHSNTCTFKNVVIKIVDGQVVYIAYTDKSDYSVRTTENTLVLYNFGTTTITVPEYTAFPADED